MAAPTRVSATASVFNTTTSPKTVSTISVTAGDLIVVTALNENGSGTFGTPTSTGLTFTARNNIGLANTTCRVAQWTAPIASTGTISVSLTAAGTAAFYGIVVEVWSNHGGVGAVGNNGNSGGSGAPSISIITTAANSGISWGVADFNAADGTTRTYRAINGNTAQENSYFRDSAHYTLYVARHADAGAAGTVAFGLSAPAGQAYTGAGVEILAVGGADPVPPFLVMAPYGH